jgi:hypothetical protein
LILANDRRAASRRNEEDTQEEMKGEEPRDIQESGRVGVRESKT